MKYETQSVPRHRSEKKPNYALRRTVAIGALGLASLFGVNKLMEITTDDSQEKAAQETEQSMLDKLNSGQDIGVKTISYELFSGVKVRKTPVSDNKNNLGDLSDNIAFTVDSNQSLIVHNPITSDKHGDWVGFLDPRNNSETKLSYDEDDILWVDIGGLSDQKTKDGSPFVAAINPADTGFTEARLNQTGRLEFESPQSETVAGEIATGYFLTRGK